MVHFRSTVEELALRGDIPALVAIDVDLVNMFGSVEWDEMRGAVDAAEFPELASWMEWHHRQATATVLPSGEEFTTDRGAEQGDGFGTVQAGRTPGKARSAALNSPTKLACEEWYVDDGQASSNQQMLMLGSESLTVASQPLEALVAQLQKARQKALADFCVHWTSVSCTRDGTRIMSS